MGQSEKVMGCANKSESAIRVAEYMISEITYNFLQVKENYGIKLMSYVFHLIIQIHHLNEDHAFFQSTVSALTPKHTTM